MRTTEFISRLDHGRIIQAIKDAEMKTSGEIRVYVQRGVLKEDPVVAAERNFQQLGMEKTRERNGVLIFVAPRVQKFAVIGDEGVHQKCGAEFWQALVDAMREHFQKQNFTEALVNAIKETGRLLAGHFPRKGDNRDELPDEIIEG